MREHGAAGLTRQTCQTWGWGRAGAECVGSGGRTVDSGPHRGWAFPKLEVD